MKLLTLEESAIGGVFQLQPGRSLRLCLPCREKPLLCTNPNTSKATRTTETLKPQISNKKLARGKPSIRELVPLMVS